MASRASISPRRVAALRSRGDPAGREGRAGITARNGADEVVTQAKVQPLAEKRQVSVFGNWFPRVKPAI